MPSRPQRRLAPRPQGRDHGGHDQYHPAPERGAEKRTGRDKCLGQPGQRLATLLIHGYDLRHDIGQQHGDHAECDHGHHGGINQREDYLLPQRFTGLEIVGEARQHFRQTSGFSAGTDEPAIERRKCARIPRERRRQRLAGRDVCAQRSGEPGGTWIVSLFTDRSQRLVQRQPGLSQRGQLARGQRQQRRRQA